MNHGYRKANYWLKPCNIETIKGWIRDGLSIRQVAQNMNIGHTTLYSWCKKYPALQEAVNNTRETVDYQVENALFKRALGYEYDEYVYNNEGEIVETRRKHQPPDTKACFLWLKNRKPQQWRDTQQIEANINHTAIPKLQELSIQELQQLAGAMLPSGQTEDIDV